MSDNNTGIYRIHHYTTQPAERGFKAYLATLDTRSDDLAQLIGIGHALARYLRAFGIDEAVRYKIQTLDTTDTCEPTWVDLTDDQVTAITTTGTAETDTVLYEVTETETYHIRVPSRLVPVDEDDDNAREALVDYIADVTSYGIGSVSVDDREYTNVDKVLSGPGK